MAFGGGSTAYVDTPIAMKNFYNTLYWGTNQDTQDLQETPTPADYAAWAALGGVGIEPGDSLVSKVKAALDSNPFDSPADAPYDPSDALDSVDANYTAAMAEVAKLVGRSLIIDEKTGQVEVVPSSTTLRDTDVLTQEDSYWVGGILEMMSGVNNGLTRSITGSYQALKHIVFAPEFPQAINVGDAYKVTLGGGNWKELITEGIIGSDAYIDNIVGKALASIDSSVIDDEVDEFESGADKDYLRSLSRFAGGMVDINAVCGSAFIMGMALMEDGRAGGVRKYRTGLRKEFYQLIIQVHSKFTSQAIEDMLITMRVSAGLSLDNAKALTTAGRYRMLAEQEKIMEKIKLDREKEMWPIDVYSNVAPIVAGLAGVQPVPTKTFAWQASLSGAAGGAVGGAAALAPFAPAGIGIGAALGAIGGAGQ